MELPRYSRVDRICETAIGLESPCAILTENGPGFSLIVARTISQSFQRSRLDLEFAFQLRIDQNRTRYFREFRSIEVIRNEEGIWIAREPDNGRIFYSPSEEPYHLIYLSAEEYERLHDEEVQHRSDKLFDFCRLSFGKLPGFYAPNEKTLVTPANYACASDRFPANTKFL